MATHDYIISNATFPATRTDINNVLGAIVTKNSSATTPTDTYAYMWWYDTATTTLKIRNRDDDAWISFASFDQDNDTVNFIDSEVSIAGVTTSATGTVLTLSDSTTTSSVNFIIDNQKEIRFRETTANGTNYVALKSPASVASDLTFTLPATDGASGQALVTDGSGVLSFASSGTSWQAVQTTGFTASAGNGYPCNTTSSAFTVTLPASASAGDTIQIVDYAGTFNTNNLTVNPNGLKIQTGTGNRYFNINRIALTFTYIDSTQGWSLSSGYLESTNPFYIPPYDIDFLVVAGGGGASSLNAAGAPNGGGGAGGYRTSTQTSIPSGILITVTVGDGGAGVTGENFGVQGSSSSISGSGLTTITSAGGGGGGGGYLSSATYNGRSGGSGGGGGNPAPSAGGGTGGTGNTPSTSPSQGSNGGNGNHVAGVGWGGGGGGGASATGGNANGSGSIGGTGGNGTASSITGSSVTYAGGGGGAGLGNTANVGGTGGGGKGQGNGVLSENGTVNTGGGGGGGNSDPTRSGGKGVVILSMPSGSFSGTTTGSPTEATSGANKILTFTGSGSYTT